MDHTGELRSLLHRATPASWQALVDRLDRWPAGPQALQHAGLLDYCHRVLQGWSPHVRRTAPPGWVERALHDGSATPMLRLADHIDLDHTKLSVAGLRRLLALPELASLRHLTLSDGGLGDDHGSALASAALPHLLTLDLRDNELGDHTARALATTATLGSLHTLHLMGNPIGAAGAAALRERPGLRVTAVEGSVLVARDVGASAELLRLEPEGMFVVGRGSGSDGVDLRLSNPNVSRRHLSIHTSGFQVYAVDLASENGTNLVGVGALTGYEMRELRSWDRLRLVGPLRPLPEVCLWPSHLEEADMEARLARLHRSDPLTGLLDRSTIMAQLQADVRSVAAIMGDVDHLKRLNARLGHLAGDRVLHRVGALIAGETGGPVVAGRVGGQEFLLLIEGAGTLEAAALAERLRQAISAWDWAAELEAPDVTVTMSFGVAALTEDVGWPAGAEASALQLALFRVAERRLRRAKARGRDRVEASGAHM